MQAEKAKHFLYEAKYGRFGGLGDPLHALQRDSELTADSSFDESAVKAMYDDQLTQLDNLISTQHSAQQQMREQLGAVDKRFHKVTVCYWLSIMVTGGCNTDSKSLRRCCQPTYRILLLMPDNPYTVPGDAPKMPLRLGYPAPPHLIRDYLDAPKSTTQTALRLVWPFL